FYDSHRPKDKGQMIEIPWQRFKLTPFAHQRVAVEALVRHPAFALFDEMGVGKSKPVVDAACCLYTEGEIDTVLVVCPASVRIVWIDPAYGEVHKNAWVPTEVHEFHARERRVWTDAPKALDHLRWLITNYEYV